MVYKQHHGKWLMMSVMLSSSLIAAEPLMQSTGAHTADWECRASSVDGDWLCRTSALSEYTVPLDAIAVLRPEISHTSSALNLPRTANSGQSVKVLTASNVIDQSGRSGDVPAAVNFAPSLSLSPDARKLIAMLQHEEAYTILWYAGRDKEEAAKMREAVGQIEDPLLLVSERQDLKEYVIVSGLFLDEKAALRDLNARHLEGSLAFLRPTPWQVRDLNNRTISQP